MELLDHLSKSCEQILSSKPNARIIIADVINQLNVRDLMSQHNLAQMVRKVTTDHRVLDVFLTNCAHIWKSPVVFNGLVRSDHLAVMVTPGVAAKPDRSFVYFREVRVPWKIQMVHKLEACVWSNALSCDDITEAIYLLENILKEIFNECFPLIKVKVSSRDPLVCRHWLNTCVPLEIGTSTDMAW